LSPIGPGDDILLSEIATPIRTARVFETRLASGAVLSQIKDAIGSGQVQALITLVRIREVRDTLDSAGESAGFHLSWTCSQTTPPICERDFGLRSAWREAVHD